eukprot:TRINITY_DN51813_c0_g1_i1.p1 TRINITY_DN51813_c0_g1~~TRINITY_DN51813_c0_g1_i1.p1  ORF type:complete len:627 (-),score=93.29 TRINITY_DN51813_c0_g1_i1:1333-3156(-)
MDAIKAAQNYINRIVTDVGGLKALLLDDETMGMISLVYSRTTILEKEVFLIDRLDNDKREKMPHLKCVVFVRPTQRNITLLEKELKVAQSKARYTEYHLFFTNTVEREWLAKLAQADENELVKQVQEYYADYYAINREVFTLGIPSVLSELQAPGKPTFDRMAQGILSVLLAMKRRPYLRYQAQSQDQICEQLGRSVQAAIQKEHELFNFGIKDSCLLLIMDRSEDPVTPLLTQWTYQAMIHEFFKINNNRVILPSKKKDDPSSSSSSYDPQQPTEGEQKDKQADNEVVLSCEYDHFFNKNLYCNWGDLCLNIKQFVDEFKAQQNTTSNISSVEDLKNFMHKFPEFKKMGGNVSKHVNLVGAISEEVKQRGLLEISVVEQEIACDNDKQTHYNNLAMLLSKQDPPIAPQDALRLVLLFVLRYEKTCKKDIPHLMQLLEDAGVPPEQTKLVDTMLGFAGAAKRNCDLFGKEGIVKEGFKIIRGLAKGFNDVENVYTQHEPLIKTLLNQIMKAKLREEFFPYHERMRPASKDWRPKEIVLFVVGGASYEEVLFVNAYNDPSNKNNSVNADDGKKGKEKFDVKVLLGSTRMLNSVDFMEEVSYLKQDSIC